ncbi:glutamate--cysteine ligase [Yinghuangia sp. ASG 101]|uniref:glutamate--cysteine ligase n=1 Tax=Yinghuangia sp. ASG 101 TaxID=2896848 RepID=UPI001E40C275|nr:glutamate--cysteine ligase [Yinghuangia sp. ASG 101]UGQ10777.1 glutamate--cysteine ligase [Yinghuangia sp. ASG 101]
MGEEVDQVTFTRSDRQRYRHKLRLCLETLERLLADGRFESPRKLMGVEIELNLTDADGLPCMANDRVLDRIASPDFQTELGQFNIEVNIPPHRLVGPVFSELAEELRTSLDYADRKAAESGARIVMIGILPTLTDAHMVLENLSHNPRYTLLNDQILMARGEDIQLQIEGVERLETTSTSIVPEAACTSVQLHLQVTPDNFAAVWNAAQSVSGVQVALGANSPFLYGRELWRETRPILFEQSCDTRPEELIAQGVRPLTWFGERWIGSVTDLFAENVRYFPSLLPICDPEDPVAALDRGDIPHLPELRLHNGTIYRWNRPVYDVARGKPHLRVENRVLPAGPTVDDILANAAFYYGVVRSLVEDERPVWERMPFAEAADNFHTGARHGVEAELAWPGLGRVPVTELVLRELLPRAYEGLEAWGIDARERDYYLGIIEGRCVRRTNGAAWQSAVFRHYRDRRGLDRLGALRAMTLRYAELMRGGDPVHMWPVP